MATSLKSPLKAVFTRLLATTTAAATGKTEVPKAPKFLKKRAAKVAANGNKTPTTVSRKRGPKAAGGAKTLTAKKGTKRSANGTIKSKEAITADDDADSEPAADTLANLEHLPVGEMVKMEGGKIKIEEGTFKAVTDKEHVGKEA
ncbi:hypothetical protein MMC13_005259 [Lambiella insularis]|nr:hypothetical protein [Lambiella insularis]